MQVQTFCSVFYYADPDGKVVSKVTATEVCEQIHQKIYREEYAAADHDDYDYDDQKKSRSFMDF